MFKPKIIEILKIRKVQLTILLFLIIFFVTYKVYFVSNGYQHQDLKVVESYRIKPDNITSTIRLIATINAKKQAIMIAQEQGSLNIIIDSGSEVKKSELIASIENPEIEKNYKLMVNAESIAKSQLDRASKLLNSGTYSKTEFENAKNNHLIVQKNLTDSKISFDKLNIYAPFDGIVGPYKYKLGDQVQLNDKIVTVYDPDYLRVDFDIPSSVLSQVKDGQTVKVFDKKYRISTVQKILDQETHATPVFVEIQCATCVIGSTTKVDLDLVSHKQVIVIPFEAVFLKQGSNFVYVIKENKLELRPVELGIKEKELIEVTSGLESGEEIVSTSTARLYPGLSVKVHQEQK